MPTIAPLRSLRGPFESGRCVSLQARNCRMSSKKPRALGGPFTAKDPLLGCGRKTSDLLGWLAAQLRALSTHYHLNTPKSWRKFSHGTQAKVVSSKTKWEMREPARCSSPTGGPLASSPARRKTRSPGGWERGRSEGPPHARFVCCEYLKASPLSRKRVHLAETHEISIHPCGTARPQAGGI